MLTSHTRGTVLLGEPFNRAEAHSAPSGRGDRKIDLRRRLCPLTAKTVKVWGGTPPKVVKGAVRARQFKMVKAPGGLET